MRYDTTLMTAASIVKERFNNNSLISTYVNMPVCDIITACCYIMWSTQVALYPSYFLVIMGDAPDDDLIKPSSPQFTIMFNMKLTFALALNHGRVELLSHNQNENDALHLAT